jgi:hypothetical protein
MALASGSPYALLVEVTGKADWIDVTFFALRFGLPRTYLREVATAFPLNGFYPTPAWPMVADHAAVDEVVPFELAFPVAVGVDLVDEDGALLAAVPARSPCPSPSTLSLPTCRRPVSTSAAHPASPHPDSGGSKVRSAGRAAPRHGTLRPPHGAPDGPPGRQTRS